MQIVIKMLTCMYVCVTIFLNQLLPRIVKLKNNVISYYVKEAL